MVSYEGEGDSPLRSSNCNSVPPYPGNPRPSPGTNKSSDTGNPFAKLPASIINRAERDVLYQRNRAGELYSFLLRDLARQLSAGGGCGSLRVAVVDEREEIAAVYEGVAQNDLGYNCDVLSGYPKGEAILSALRSLSPEVIICDEAGGMEEVQAIEAGVNAGVKFIASIHASTKEDLLHRPQARRLLETGAFDRVVMLAGGGLPGRISQIYRAEELIDEICGDVLRSGCLYRDGSIF